MIGPGCAGSGEAAGCGSPVADFVANATEPLAAMDLLKRLGIDNAAIRNLTTSYCTRFDLETPDDPGVRYYSIAANCSARVPLLFRASYRIVHAREGENDGAVSVRSARHGTDLGTWAVDHLRAVNAAMPSVAFGGRADVLDLYDALLDRLEGDGALVRSS